MIFNIIVDPKTTPWNKENAEKILMPMFLKCNFMEEKVSSEIPMIINFITSLYKAKTSFTLTIYSNQIDNQFCNSNPLTTI